MLPDKDGAGVGGGQVYPDGEEPSVSLFRDYLRLRTVHPQPDYGKAPLTAALSRIQAMPFGNVTAEFFIVVFVGVAHSLMTGSNRC